MSDLRDQIYKSLREYRMSNMREEDTDQGYPLVDLCTPDGRQISEGEEELFLIAVAIAGDLFKPDPKQQFVAEDCPATTCDS